MLYPPPMRLAVLVLILTATAVTRSDAQWEIEDSHTTASLRGIHNVGGGVAWASGTGGTVLRTTDDGKAWQTCPIPLAGTKDTAEKLDFRGIQAFDENTAIVMSSGPGDQSRLYKTTDGCRTWKLLFTNPDKDGFWDAIHMSTPERGVVIGDPLERRLKFERLLIRHSAPVFPLFGTVDSGATWLRLDNQGLIARSDKAGKPTESIFAASNSSFIVRDSLSEVLFITGGVNGGLHRFQYAVGPMPMLCKGSCTIYNSPISKLAWGVTAGGFSLAGASEKSYDPVVLVGGDYKLPDSVTGTAATCNLDGEGFTSRYVCDAAQTPPHGYRSAVAYDPATKTWVTVGPNGTDISTDDGRNWRALTPTALDEKDADKNWNALSLPFVVGPKGRIGKLRPAALAPASPSSSKADAKP